MHDIPTRFRWRLSFRYPDDDDDDDDEYDGDGEYDKSTFLLLTKHSYHAAW
jgi:hypothetical protein